MMVKGMGWGWEVIRLGDMYVVHKHNVRGTHKRTGRSRVQKRRTDLRKLPYGCLSLSPAPTAPLYTWGPQNQGFSGCVKAQSCQDLNILLETQGEKYSLHGETTSSVQKLEVTWIETQLSSFTVFMCEKSQVQMTGNSTRGLVVIDGDSFWNVYCPCQQEAPHCFPKSHGGQVSLLCLEKSLGEILA